MAVEVSVEELSGRDPEVEAMLVELTLEEQEHYRHPRESRDEVRRRLRADPSFVGENHLLVARDPQGGRCGVCWLVLFDPGTGLEAEIAELYVIPRWRGQGVARRLVEEAVQLLRRRQVTFAAVWTRPDNPAALSAYRAAGFSPTEQTVLTWLPLPE